MDILTIPFNYIFIMSICACVVIPVVLLLRLMLKKAPKWVSVLLWGIVAFCLILTPIIASQFSFLTDELVNLSYQNEVSEIPEDTPTPKPEDTPASQEPGTTTAPKESTDPTNAPKEHSGYANDPAEHNPDGIKTVDMITLSIRDMPKKSMKIITSHLEILSIIWIVGVVSTLSYTSISYWRLRRKVATAVRLIENIYQSENVAFPFVFGMAKPRIYLPFKISLQELEHVIAHEQAHIQRRDHWWKPLGFLLLTLHWFNPMMWLAYILLCRDIELACDEKVIRALGNEQRADYTQALVTCSVKRHMNSAYPLAFGAVGVKDRVKAVMNYRRPTLWIKLVSVTTCIAVIVCSLPTMTMAGSLYDLIKPAEDLPAAENNEIISPIPENTPTAVNIAYPVPGASILFDPETGTVIGYEGDISEVNIPATINGVPVVAIGENAFSSCPSMGEITLPSSITTIGEGAFDGCTGLNRIDIPSSVTTIGPAAFSGCDMLEGIWVNENNSNYSSDSNGILFNKNKTELLACPGAFAGSYTVPNGVTTIGDSAFYACYNLTAITFPDSLTAIGDFSFSWCMGLTSISLPDSLATVGDFAFNSCSGLASISLPDSLTTIGDSAFSYCEALARVDIPASVTTVGPGAFSCCTTLNGIWVDENNLNYSSDSNGILFNKNKTELLACPSTLPGSYTVPNSVITIGYSAFDTCYNLTAITLPDSLTTIGDRAFYGCHNLTAITFSDSLTTIGNSAFYWCENLASIALPNSVTTIGSHAFSGCRTLVRVDIPASVTTVGPGAFSICTALNGIWVDENNLYYSSDSNGILFNKNKTELLACPTTFTGSYTVPNGVTTIGDSAFASCVGLTTISLPDSLTTIGDSAFSDCATLTSISLPDSLTTIGYYAFGGCYNLAAIAFPDHLEYIGPSAFTDCEKLSSLTIPDGVTTIGDWAFDRCVSLERVAIPASVTNIGEGVFGKCPHLTHIYYGGSQTQWEQMDKGFHDFDGVVIHYGAEIT